MRLLSSLKKDTIHTTLLCVIVLCVVTLSGCGFHLRGETALPPVLAKLQLDVERLKPQWQARIKQQLNTANVKVVRSAPYTLLINEISDRREVASYNARAKAAQYDLILTLNYQLISSRDQQVVQDKQLSTQRTYQFDEGSVTGSQQEERIILDELSNELMQKLVQQLQWANVNDNSASILTWEDKSRPQT